MFVTSTDPPGFDPDSPRGGGGTPENPERPLPRKLDPYERSQTPEHVFSDSRVKPRTGKASLDALQEMVALHRSDPRKHSPETMARERELDVAQVQHLVRHFAVFDLHQGSSVTDRRRAEDPLLPQPEWEEAPQREPVGAKTLLTARDDKDSSKKTE